MAPGSDERRIRVMLADDYVGMHQALTRLLTPTCDIVGSVTEGTRIVGDTTRLKPDVLVLDIQMPGSNWLETCARLKAALPTLRIVIYSVEDDTAIQSRAREAGAADFVSKNLIASDLLPAIRRAVQADAPS